MPENDLDLAKKEYRRGNYAESLQLARRAKTQTKLESQDRACLICECLQFQGEFAEALATAQAALQTDLTAKLAARYWTVVGRIHLEQARFDDAAAAFRKGMREAERASDLVRLSGLQQLWLITVGPHFGSGLSSAVREAYHTAVKTADASCLAGFHVRLTRLEAQRGSFQQALHHIGLAESLLERCDNLELSALFNVNKSCVLATTGSLGPARKSAELAASLAEQAGHVRLSMAAAANVAHIAVTAGELSVAEPWLRKARKVVDSLDTVEMALLETLACYSLVRGDFQAAAQTLAEARRTYESQYLNWATVSETYSLLTELYLHKKLGNESERARLLLTVREAADAHNNWYGNFLVSLAEAESLYDHGEFSAGASRVASCFRTPPTHIVHWANLNRIAARTLWSEGRTSSARRRLLRASSGALARGTRLSWTDALREVRATQPTEAWAQAYSLDEQDKHASTKFSALMNHPSPNWFEAHKPIASLERDPLDGFDDAVAILEATEDPELFAREVLASLIALGISEGAALIARTDAGLRLIASTGWTKSDCEKSLKPPAAGIRLELGRVDGKALEIVFEPKQEVRSLFAANGMRRLVDAARALQTQRKDQQRLGALWQPEIIVEEPGAVFSSAPMIELMQTARKVAATTLPVLLLGDTGTGKEVLARAIHRASPRAGHIFLPFNCSAVPRDMIESQLFGYRRGSFTGANADFPGIIRSAEGGTLFLDEIGELSLDLQPKLLRFLETNEVHPIGEGKPIKVDVRVIAATNADLDDLVQTKEFREDLYYRLNIVRFHMPVLSERREEVPPLVMHLLRRFEMDEKKHSIKVSDELMEYLLLYRWPGNVRQLSNELRKMVAMVDSGETLTPEQLSPAIRATRRTVAVDPDAEPAPDAAASGQDAAPAPAPDAPAPDTRTASTPATDPPPADAPAAAEPPPTPASLTLTLDQQLPDAVQALERAMIEHAIARADGRVEEAARLLGISRKGLFLKRRRWQSGGDPAPPAA